uniref:NADH dehydrogenase subunit 6 n=1 Tax=Chalcophora japonica TaxID=2818490 RepID=UPI002000D717|nr:NADH dehydrogenase subunit 6 [Chalcophora japonica]UNQ87654.1 NADH dehydrogenase subunit 6 [Chalcophora japonica]
MILILASITVLSILFLTSNHPLTMGFILLMQTAFISMITGMMNINFWYSYILFLIMVGGMLVLFVYMTSVASNEMFKFSNKTFASIIAASVMFMLTYITLDKFFPYSKMKGNDLITVDNSTNWIISLSKYLNFPTNAILTFLIIYLFVTLIAVVKITEVSHGPLRQKF